MKKIEISVIPHKKQRYETVGDWFYDKDETLHIRVSDMGDWKKEMLVAVHELVEVILCKANGVTQGVVDDFDNLYEEEREKGNPLFQGEPGDDDKAPYGVEHCFATAVERMLCAALDVSWGDYDKKVNEL